MTLVQLEYIVALDTYRHFGLAAEKCFVTQPTLSMQVQKLEEELGLQLFDRSKQPVVCTEVGALVVAQARVILSEASKIKEILNEQEKEVTGTLRIGIIPTLAPYLLPLFLPLFLEKYPGVQLIVEELVTEQLIFKLRHDLIDTGILVTPLQDPNLQEYPLFYESFVAYISKSNPLFKQKIVDAAEIDPSQVWLLQEGHCMRSQVLNFCADKTKSSPLGNLHYEAGSIETLKKIVELNQGITLLPELATLDLTSKQSSMVRYFADPEPVREVSLVTHRHFVKKRLIQVLSEEILLAVPEKMRNSMGKNIVGIKV